MPKIYCENAHLIEFEVEQKGLTRGMAAVSISEQAEVKTRLQ